MNKQKQAKKITPKAVCLTVLCALLALIVLVVGTFIIIDRVRHGKFYQDARREFTIPGLSDNFTPQGFEDLSDYNLYLCSGYMSDGRASRLYVIDRDGNAGAPIQIKNSDGSDHLGHAGGISSYPGTDYVYLAGSDCLHLLSLSDILDGDGTATIQDSWEILVNPAYCTVFDGYLYAGSFYYPGAYETPKQEWYLTPAGDQHTSLVAAYRLDSKTGALSEAPEFLYSTRDMAQGVAFSDADTLVLSTSWGMNTSHLYCYDLTRLNHDLAGTYSLSEDVQIPVYYLDSSVCFADIAAPCMSEELVIRDGNVYIMTEAASNKYIFGKLLGAQRLYSYPIPEKEEK